MSQHGATRGNWEENIWGDVCWSCGRYLWCSADPGGNIKCNSCRAMDAEEEERVHRVAILVEKWQRDKQRWQRDGNGTQYGKMMTRRYEKNPNQQEAVDRQRMEDEAHDRNWQTAQAWSEWNATRAERLQDRWHGEKQVDESAWNSPWSCGYELQSELDCHEVATPWVLLGIKVTWHRYHKPKTDSAGNTQKCFRQKYNKTWNFDHTENCNEVLHTNEFEWAVDPREEGPPMPDSDCFNRSHHFSKGKTKGKGKGRNREGAGSAGSCQGGGKGNTGKEPPWPTNDDWEIGLQASPAVKAPPVHHFSPREAIPLPCRPPVKAPPVPMPMLSSQPQVPSTEQPPMKAPPPLPSTVIPQMKAAPPGQPHHANAPQAPTAKAPPAHLLGMPARVSAPPGVCPPNGPPPPPPGNPPEQYDMADADSADDTTAHDNLEWPQSSAIGDRMYSVVDDRICTRPLAPYSAVGDRIWS